MPPEPLDARLRALARKAGVAFGSVEPLPADVGRRRYYRLVGDGEPGVLAVVYPADEMDSARRWLSVRRALGRAVRVPEVLATSSEGDLHLVEDFGRRSLADAWRRAPGPERSRLLSLAGEAAAAIASLPDPGINPPFTAPFFLEELRASARSFFALTGAPISDAEWTAHEGFARRLCEEIAAHPAALVHRDFHLNNLFEIDSRIGVIDFQDARRGPDSYDVASLCFERETLIEADADATVGALRAYRQGRPGEPGLEERVARVSLQRSWKAAGTFARAIVAGRKTPYGEFLRRQIGRVLDLLGDSPAEREFAEVLDRRSGRMTAKG